MLNFVVEHTHLNTILQNAFNDDNCQSAVTQLETIRNYFSLFNLAWKIDIFCSISKDKNVLITYRI